MPCIDQCKKAAGEPMKKETGNYIFRILKAFIYGEEPVLTGSSDWEEILYYARIHAISGIIGYVAAEFDLCGDPVTAAQLEKDMINTFGYQYRRNVQMKKLIRILNEKEIDHILMKGYLIKGLYPVPELRWFGDIDFVIHKDDRIKTDELMKELGYEVSDNWEPVYSYHKDSEYYEIHTEILDADINNSTQKEYFGNIWNHVYNTGLHTYHFDREYHFIYLIAHLAKHVYRKGAGVRMYLDIALIINKYGDSLNWGYILNELDQLGLRRFFFTVCTVCELWFEIQAPCEVERIDPAAISEFTEITLEGGTFGANNANDAIETLKDADESDSRIRTVIHQIFPPAKEIQSRYTYLQKHRWLLPVAWIDRVFRNRDVLNRRIHLAREIVVADEEEVRHLRSLIHEIGL